MASRSWNRVELIGNVTKDPELRYTPSGAAVCTFSIATNRTFVSDGEKREETDFHRLVAWNKLAELCSQLIKKGNKIFVSGRLQNRQWEQDGQTKYITEIVLEDMILLTSKGESNSSFAADDIPMPAEMPSRQAEEAPRASAPAPKPAPTATNDATDEAEEAAPEEKRQKVETEVVEDLDDLPF
jgi:single-strand DNA-binding protein